MAANVGLGFHGMWGLSPACDLGELAACGAADDDGNNTPLRILVAEPGDIRHVLMSVTRRRRRAPTRPMHLYGCVQASTHAHMHARTHARIHARTLARTHAHKPHGVTYHTPYSSPPLPVVERPVECLARHLLMLQIVSDWELPIR